MNHRIRNFADVIHAEVNLLLVNLICNEVHRRRETFEIHEDGFQVFHLEDCDNGRQRGKGEGN